MRSQNLSYLECRSTGSSRNTRRFCNKGVSGIVGLVKLSSISHGVLVSRASGFAVETIFKNNDFLVLTQRVFRQHFNIHRNDVSLVAILYCCGRETSEKQRLLKKVNL